MSEVPAKRARRGTEVREKQHVISFRMSDAERAELEALAEREGLSLGGYIRSRVLTAPTTRATRRPTVEVHALVKLQAELNKIGSNIHQLLKRVNFGDTPHGQEVREAFAGYREAIGAILTLRGFK